MTKQEFALLTSALKTYYPREKLLPNPQAMELWFNQLKDIPYKVAETALNKWVATNKWSPSIADIREQANEIVNGVIPDWGNGWEQVEHAIRYFGIYNATRAMESLDDITRETVKRLGFNNLCLSENPQADRANFRMIYEQLAERKATNDQVPEDIKKLINNMPLMLNGEAKE